MNRKRNKATPGKTDTNEHDGDRLARKIAATGGTDKTLNVLKLSDSVDNRQIPRWKRMIHHGCSIQPLGALVVQLVLDDVIAAPPVAAPPLAPRLRRSGSGRHD